MCRENKQLLVWITVYIPVGSRWWTCTQHSAVFSVSPGWPNMFNLAPASSAIQAPLEGEKQDFLLKVPAYLSLNSGKSVFLRQPRYILASEKKYATFHFADISEMTACQVLAPDTLHLSWKTGTHKLKSWRQRTEPMVDVLVELFGSECNKYILYNATNHEVKHVYWWWPSQFVITKVGTKTTRGTHSTPAVWRCYMASLICCQRPPLEVRGVFFQDQMDGSDIPTEIYIRRTTCMKTHILLSHIPEENPHFYTTKASQFISIEMVRSIVCTFLHFKIW